MFSYSTRSDYRPCWSGMEPNFYEGAAAPATSNTTSVQRASNGCQDTDNNASDFIAGAPAPRNTASSFNVCLTVEAPPSPAQRRWMAQAKLPQQRHYGELQRAGERGRSVVQPQLLQQRCTHCNRHRRFFQLHVEFRYRFCVWRNLHARPSSSPGERPGRLRPAQ